MKKFTYAMFLVAFNILGGVDVTTSTPEVYYRGGNEVAGSINFEISDSSFAIANPESPLTVLIKPSSGTLSKTVVDLDSNDSTVNRRVIVPLNSSNLLGGVDIVAPVDTVTIDRWVAGESAIWVSVNYSSNVWLEDNSGFRPPTNNNRVRFVLGLVSEAYPPTGNTPHPFREGLPNVPVDTIICLNLMNSNITSLGDNTSRVYIDLISYVNADPVLGQPGDNAGVAFSGSGAIATGKDRSCDVSSYTQDPLTEPLCDTKGDPSLASVENVVTVQLSCDSSGLETLWYPGSSVVLRSVGDYGFDQFNLPGFVNTGSSNEILLNGFTEVVEDSSFVIVLDGEDVTLYREVRVVYTGDSPFMNPKFSVSVPVYMNRSLGSGEVFVDWNLEVLNTNRCGSTGLSTNTERFLVGGFSDCVGTTNTLTLGYLPKVNGNSDFWAALAISNQNTEDVNVKLVLYSDGVSELVELGNHPSYSITTWTFLESDTGDSVLINNRGETVLLETGTERSYANLSATFVTRYEEDLNGVLGAYVIIGSLSTGNINGSYIAQ